MALTITLLDDHLGQKRPKQQTHESCVDALALITVYEADVAASGTIQITDTDAVQNVIITITTSDGTVITCTETTTTTTTDTNSPTFEASTGSSGPKRTAAATNIATCLNANSKLTATSVSDTVTVTQATSGSDGNNTILAPHPGGIVVTGFVNGAASDVITASDLGMDSITSAIITGNSRSEAYTANIKCNDTGSYINTKLPAQTPNSIQLHLLDNSATDDIEVADGVNITDTTLRIRVWGSAKL